MRSRRGEHRRPSSARSPTVAPSPTTCWPAWCAGCGGAAAEASCTAGALTCPVRARPSASSRCRATSASTWRALEAAGVRRASPVRRPAELDARRRAGAARRRVDHDRQAGPHVRPARAAARARSPTGCRPTARAPGMILLADRIDADGDRSRRPSAASTSRCAATPSAARSTRSRRTSTSTASTGGPVHAVFIRAPWVEESARRPRRSAGSEPDRPPVGSSRFGRGTCWPRPSTRN